MAFESFADFITMGKHGSYVWAAYGVTFVIVVWNVLQPWLHGKKLIREQAGALRREAQERRR
jgi:heme exporter protein D